MVMNPCMSCGAQRNAKPRADCATVSGHIITRYTRDGTPVPVPGQYIGDGYGWAAQCSGIPHADRLTVALHGSMDSWPRPICGSLLTHEPHSTPLGDTPPTHVPEYARWLERAEMDSVSEILNGMIRYGAERLDSPLTLLEKLHEAGWRFMPHCGEGCTGNDCTFCRENSGQ